MASSPRTIGVPTCVPGKTACSGNHSQSAVALPTRAASTVSAARLKQSTSAGDSRGKSLVKGTFSKLLRMSRSSLSPLCATTSFRASSTRPASTALVTAAQGNWPTESSGWSRGRGFGAQGRQGGARLRSERGGYRRAKGTHTVLSHPAPGGGSEGSAEVDPRDRQAVDRACDGPRGRVGGSPERHDRGEGGNEDDGSGAVGAQRLDQARVSVDQAADGSEEQHAGDDQEQDDEQGKRGHGGSPSVRGAPPVSAGVTVRRGGRRIPGFRENPFGAPASKGTERGRGRLTGAVSTDSGPVRAPCDRAQQVPQARTTMDTAETGSSTLTGALPRADTETRLRIRATGAPLLKMATISIYGRSRARAAPCGPARGTTGSRTRTFRLPALRHLRHEICAKASYAEQ